MRGCSRGCSRGPPSPPRAKSKNPRDGLNKMKRVPKQSQDRRPSSPSIGKGASIRTESPRGRKVPSSLPVLSASSKNSTKVPSLSTPSKKSKASKKGHKVPSSLPSDKHNGSKAAQSGSRVKESSRMILTPSIYDALTESRPVSESDRSEEISSPKEKTKKKK